MLLEYLAVPVIHKCCVSQSGLRSPFAFQLSSCWLCDVENALLFIRVGYPSSLSDGYLFAYHQHLMMADSIILYPWSLDIDGGGEGEGEGEGCDLFDWQSMASPDLGSPWQDASVQRKIRGKWYMLPSN